MRRKSYETYKLCIALAVPTSSRAKESIWSLIFVPFSLFLLFRFGFLNWVRCKPVGPRRWEGADGSRNLFASSIGTQNPELGPCLRCLGPWLWRDGTKASGEC